MWTCCSTTGSTRPWLRARGSAAPALSPASPLQHGRHALCSDNLLKEYMGQTVLPDAAPQDLAMILFTSGTTGRGKGVMLSHGNLIDNVFCTTEAEDVSGETYLNVLPIHHVFCINATFSCPCAMATRFV